LVTANGQKGLCTPQFDTSIPCFRWLLKLTGVSTTVAERPARLSSTKTARSKTNPPTAASAASNPDPIAGCDTRHGRQAICRCSRSARPHLRSGRPAIRDGGRRRPRLRARSWAGPRDSVEPRPGPSAVLMQFKLHQHPRANLYRVLYRVLKKFTTSVCCEAVSA